MIFRLVPLLPVLIGTFALGNAAQAWVLAAAIAALATVLAMVGPRWELDRGRQLVASVMGAGVGYATVAALHESEAGTLGEVATRLAAAALLAAAARFLIVSPSGGRMATTALVFASLVTTGQTRAQGYGVFVVLFLLTSLWSLGTNDHKPMDAKLSARRIAVATTVGLMAAAFGIGTILGLQRVHTWITSRGQSRAFNWQPRIGFSDRMDLGALDGLLDSNVVVLRVRGPRVDYLRGVSLDFYDGGRWFKSAEAEVEARATYDRGPAGGSVVEIAAVSERTDHFFLPLEARTIATLPTEVLVDRMGSVKRAPKRGLAVARFLRGPRTRAGPAPPRASDLQLPRRIREPLEVLAREWTGNAVTASQKLDAIERRLLTEFRYARTFHRGAGMDPALDFLLRNKRGHCEYFAAALALVARAAGIPVRVIAGYRVGEQSLFGYYVVRDRNAHAWVEAWVPDQGWTTRDATPSEHLPQNHQHEASHAASALDALRVGYDDLTAWLESLTVRQTAMAGLAGFLVLLWMVGRGARGRARTELVPDDAAALPFLELLLSTLARSGSLRRKDEPVERLAARIADPQAARLLERYAAFRYGNIGDAAELAEDVAVYAKYRRKNGKLSRR